MLEDLDCAMQKWGTAGKFDPFDDIYNVRGGSSLAHSALTAYIHIDGISNNDSRRIMQGSCR